MAGKEKVTKQRAERIDPTYFRRAHPLRRARFWFSAGAAVLAVAWVGVAALLGDERPYSPGPVASAHRLFERDCAQCHVQRFSAVKDAACNVCHHALPGHRAAPAAEAPACAACHADHKGRAGLAVVADGHCNACHAEHSGIRRWDKHIDFQIEAPVRQLRFSHKKHLSADLAGGPLGCADCHAMNGAAPEPISFDAHCARCHTERLDADRKDPVPHGLDPAKLRGWIAARYAETMGVVEKPRALPGRGAEPPAWRDELIRRTDAAFGALMKRDAGCLLCHVAADDGSIRKTAIPKTWMPAARFDHAAHRSQGCKTCHDIAGREDLAKPALPHVQNCKQCHNKRGAAQTCATCHPYHRPR